MRVAIFHNFLDNIGGAEKVTLILARELKADIYTTNFDKEKIRLMGFDKILSRIFSIGDVPINAPFRQQIAMLRFRRLNLNKKYDFFIIAGDWAMSGAANNKPNLWYVHSPIREIWDLYEYTRKNTVPFYLRPIFDLWVKYNRYLNKKFLKHVGKLVCNSNNTQNRVEKYLKRKARVINPPIETKNFKYNQNKGYWLSVNRLITHKRLDLQLKAFKEIPNENLIIVGSYEKSRHFIDYSTYCQKIKPANVKILSWVDNKKLIDLYSNCKGFITTSQDEDFGMNVLEAMASGKPVIAPNEGGYKETIINNKTGILIDNINKDRIINAIKEINKQLKNDQNKYKNNCIKQSKKFDTKIFVKKILNEIKIK